MEKYIYAKGSCVKRKIIATYGTLKESLYILLIYGILQLNPELIFQLWFFSYLI